MKQFALLVLACGSWHLTVDSNSLTLVDADGFTLHMPKSSTGDCFRRSNCYQAGQFMVNLPTGKPTHAWINTDVDDNTEHRSLGERFRCEVAK